MAAGRLKSQNSRMPKGRISPPPKILVLWPSSLLVTPAQTTSTAHPPTLGATRYGPTDF